MTECTKTSSCKEICVLWCLISTAIVVYLMQQGKEMYLNTLSAACSGEAELAEKLQCYGDLYGMAQFKFLEQGFYEHYILIWLGLIAVPFILSIIKKRFCKNK